MKYKLRKQFEMRWLLYFEIILYLLLLLGDLTDQGKNSIDQQPLLIFLYLLNSILDSLTSDNLALQIFSGRQDGHVPGPPMNLRQKWTCEFCITVFNWEPYPMTDLVIVLMNFMEIVKDLGLDLRIGSLVFRQAIPELGGRI